MDPFINFRSHSRGRFLGVTCMLNTILSNNGSMAEQQRALTCWKEKADGKSGFQHEYFTKE